MGIEGSGKAAQTHILEQIRDQLNVIEKTKIDLLVSEIGKLSERVAEIDQRMLNTKQLTEGDREVDYTDPAGDEGDTGEPTHK